MPLAIFVRAEHASQDRLRAEHRKQRRRDTDDLDSAGVSRACERLRVGLHRGDTVEGGHPRLPEQELAGSGRHARIRPRHRRDDVADDDKAIGGRVGERPQQDGVDERGDIAVLAPTPIATSRTTIDAKPGRRLDHAEAVAHVGRQFVQRRKAACVAESLARLIEAAEPSSRLTPRGVPAHALAFEIVGEQVEMRGYPGVVLRRGGGFD